MKVMKKINSSILGVEHSHSLTRLAKLNELKKIFNTFRGQIS